MGVAGSVLWWDLLTYGKRRLCGVRPLNQRATRAQGLVLIHGLAGKTRQKTGWPGQAPPRGPAMADWSFSYLCRGSSSGWCDGVHIFVDNPLPHTNSLRVLPFFTDILMLFQLFKKKKSVPLTMVLPVPYYRRWMIECGAGSPCVHSRHQSPVLKRLYFILFYFLYSSLIFFTLVIIRDQVDRSYSECDWRKEERGGFEGFCAVDLVLSAVGGEVLISVEIRFLWFDLPHWRMTFSHVQKHALNPR